MNQRAAGAETDGANDMLGTIVTIITWAMVVLMGAVVVLLAMNKTSGLKLLQHRADMLPQAMLVRYAGMAVLALLAVWFNAPAMLFAILLSFAVIGLGDAFIYRRAGHPFWLHLLIGGLAGLGAVLALFSIS